ncbi:MAG: nuclear transport factor 2 family protein [Acidobacteria bacterium]|nr:nuclear transport factor 2 family protein [Acidobacteriota bacterium]
MMRRLLPMLLLMSTLPAIAQAPPAPNPDEPVHQALRQLKATMAKALNERDLNTIVANVTPNVVFTTMNGDVCHGPAEIRAYFDKMLNAPGHIVKNLTVSFEADALTDLHGGDTGIAYGSSNDHYELTNGQVFDIHGRWSCTLVKEGDRWLIANFHYSANVFDNPILNKTKQWATWAAVGAAIVALLVGFFVGRRTRRA